MSIVDDVLRIKQFREAQAELALRRQRLRVVQANAARDAARDERDVHRAFAAEEEVRLFGDLLGRLVQVRSIENVRSRVGALAGEDMRLDGELSGAEGVLDEARGVLEQCRLAQRQAEQRRETFTELVRRHTGAARREAERREEGELEEMGLLAREREQARYEPQDDEIS
ncbi:YscO family type III secretion system apparatus protein [Robbsia sp. Bb-Pol-6]|uniref:YscO family type III secretion system apparatus protein n=1 Tax=Robbsia betulipollinis TaxID=2981849 RepID=A0ABT3ZL69_9BURK|nr:YscO family type III secretion system apparatus protein [Robbsia betulipollinis]MCY0387283.1 YscO family type III secretion system apparatus protein [Robbsia betulipollinis]